MLCAPQIVLPLVLPVAVVEDAADDAIIAPPSYRQPFPLLATIVR